MGSEEFSFSIKDVFEARVTSEEEVQGWGVLASVPGGRLQEMACDALLNWQNRKAYLTEQKPESIVSMAHAVKGTISDLKRSGIGDAQIAEQILKEYPDVLNLGNTTYLDVIFGPSTGVSLGQRMAQILSKR